MNHDLHRKMLVQSYWAYIRAIQDRDSGFESLSDDELAGLSERELGQVVQEMRRLANVPPPRS